MPAPMVPPKRLSGLTFGRPENGRPYEVIFIVSGRYGGMIDFYLPV